ncbi:MAG: hypothetical protein AAGI63_05515 [Planctomycetota bacterium]
MNVLPHRWFCLSRAVCLLSVAAAMTFVQSVVLYGQSSRAPAFQYQLDEFEISIPTADEPRVKAFGRESILAASNYLQVGAVSWARGRSCVNCHTTGPYMTEYTSWSRHFGKPSDEVRASFVQAVPSSIRVKEEVERGGHKYYPGAYYTVWRSAGLAEWDRRITGELSEATDQSLRDMFAHQSDHGAFVTHGEVEVPHVTTDFQLSLQAARAVTAAPGWLVGLKDESLLGRVEKLKTWLRTAEPKNDFDRVLKLQLAHYMPDLVSTSTRDAAMNLLSAKQKADGGWSTRDMSSVDDWHFEVSSRVRDIIKNLPDADQPESDPYMTALAIVLMRQNGVPASDRRIQKGLLWLKREQRESGRWWMHSLYRGNYHFITYIATTEAMKALALCGELDAIEKGE